MAAARYHPAGCVSAALRAAGVDADAIADELRDQSRGARKSRPQSLAVVCPEPGAA